jgi:hypothetical protein
MTAIVHRPDHALVVQRYRVRRRSRARTVLLAAAFFALAAGVWMDAFAADTESAGDLAGFWYTVAVVVLVAALLCRSSYTVRASVAGVGFTGGLGHRWFPWERIDRFATQWQERDDRPQRRVLVVLRDALPQPLNPGFSHRPMTRDEVDHVARWLNEWVAYQRDPDVAPVPRLPEDRP